MRNYATTSRSAEDEYLAQLTELPNVLLVALDNLPELQRDVLLARYFEKVSVIECAKRFGVSRRSMYRLIDRAKRSLRDKAGSLYLVEGQ